MKQEKGWICSRKKEKEESRNPFVFGKIVDQPEICWNQAVGSLRFPKFFLGMWKEPWLWERPPFEFGKIHSL